MKTKLRLITFLLIIISLLSMEGMMAQCTNCSGSTSSAQNISSAIGINNKSVGRASFASGSSLIASGDYSISLGANNHSSGDYSISFGKHLMASAEGAMVIGTGNDSRAKLSNINPKSLMIGFGSKYPTLFIGTSPHGEATGRVGIGNVTEPLAKLHIKSDDREPASLFLEQDDFTKADVFIGNLSHGIQSSITKGLVFRTEKNYIFNEGNLGIGTMNPLYDLEVQGKTFTRHFTLFDQELYQENIEGYVLRSDSRGRALWANPATLNDHDWEAKGEHIYRTGGYVGIGTSEPAAQLDIADIYPAGGMNIKIGNDAYLSDIDLGHTLGIYSQVDNNIGAVKLGSSGPLLFGRDKKLGIGTKQPSTSLEVSNTLWNGQSVGLCISNPETFSWFVGMNGNSKHVNDLMIGNMDKLGNGTSSFLIMKQDGSLGVGTDDTYGYKLAVNGAVITEEVTVKVHSAWPDYVFNQDYELLPLDELEDYIKDHGHLPQIPEAEQIHAEGLNVGEMERLLLKKVEELTLYIIQQQSAIEDMKNRLNKSEKTQSN